MTHDRPCRVCPAVVRSRPLRASSRVRLCRSARRALVCSLSIAHGDSHARRSHTCRWQMAMAGYCTSPLPAAPARPRHERLTDAGSRPTRGYSQVRRAHPTHHPTRGAHARRCTHRPQTYHGHTNIRCPHEHKIPRHEQRPLSADNTKHRLVVCRPSRRARVTSHRLASSPHIRRPRGNGLLRRGIHQDELHARPRRHAPRPRCHDAHAIASSPCPVS